LRFSVGRSGVDHREQASRLVGTLQAEAQADREPSLVDWPRRVTTAFVGEPCDRLADGGFERRLVAEGIAGVDRPRTTCAVSRVRGHAPTVGAGRALAQAGDGCPSRHVRWHRTPAPEDDPVGATGLSAAKAAFERVLAEPTPADLWELQKALLVIDGEPAARARTVARAFHGCLRNLESKSASRTASRWGAVLGTAAVGSVSVGDLADTQQDALGNLLHSAVPALLEVGSALKSAQAWEVEAGLLYDDLAWFLYDELWEVSLIARPELEPAERREQIDLVVDPLLDASLPDGDRASLVVNVFRAVLAARVVRLFDGGPSSD
jgi:hypothetical protein